MADELAKGNQLEYREEGHDILWEGGGRESRSITYSSKIVGNCLFTGRGWCSRSICSVASELESKREITAMQREQIEFVTSKLNGWVTS